MPENIYSHTDTESKHPGSISIIHEDSGAISVVVKRKGMSAPSAVSISLDIFAAMVKSGADHLASKAVKPASKKKK